LLGRADVVEFAQVVATDGDVRHNQTLAAGS